MRRDPPVEDARQRPHRWCGYDGAAAAVYARTRTERCRDGCGAVQHRAVISHERNFTLGPLGIHADLRKIEIL